MPAKATAHERRHRATRALYVEIDPELRASLAAEATHTGQTLTAIVEDLLRRRYLEQQRGQLAAHLLPELGCAVRAELSGQLDELDRELKSQVRALERRLGNRVAGMLIKAIRQAYICRYLTYNLACERYGEAVAAGWDQDAAAAAGSYLRAPAPAEGTGDPPVTGQPPDQPAPDPGVRMERP